MFDAISVSERTRKPWTVAVSFAGQVVLVALAVLVPLVSTEALPRGHFYDVWIAGPPPPPPARHAESTTVKPARRPTPRMSLTELRQPAKIPQTVEIVQEDPEFKRAGVAGGTGVEGGTGDPGMGNLVIESIVRQAPKPAPPPAVPVVKETPKPIPRLQVGGQVQAAKLISGPRPVYPTLAKQARISGVVKLQAVIARDGTVVDLRAIAGHPLLIPAAISAVKQWIFQPTYLNGDPVEVATEIEVKFLLQQ